MICYRHCGTDDEPTQYLCVHPLGPHAEAMRRFDARTPAQARLLDLRTWALDVDVRGLVEVPFAEAWVSDDYAACHDLADAMCESGKAGMIVPSAALPGTRNVVVFGGRTTSPYLVSPHGATEVSASVTGEHGCGPASLVELVRFRGESHPAENDVFGEPSWAAA